MINHINVMNAEGQVYCCLRNRIVRLDEDHQSTFCSGCKMYNGNAGGAGVECLWDDIRGTNTVQAIITDPKREWASNQVRRVKTETLWSDWSGSPDSLGGSEAAV